MAESRHRSQRDDAFLASLGRHVSAALALVVVMAGAFWAIGSVDDADGDLVVADSPPATSPTGDPATSPPATGSEPAAPSPTGTGDSSPSPTQTATDDATSEEEPPPSSGGIPPSEISIQVLDAVLVDGDTAAEELADHLETDGYDVVVVNQASKVYDETTVFYTPGFEDSARQVAGQYGITRVEEKPDNLSDTVRVHLVVGRDRS